MSPKNESDTPAEDASVEQIHAADPVHPPPAAGSVSPTPVPDPAAAETPEELREQIEATRGDLGDTVEALTYKLDVKERAKDGIEERKQAAKDGIASAKETVSETAAAAKAKVEGAASSAQATATGAAQGASARADRVGEQAQENRIPVATVAAVAGVLVLVVVWRRRSR